MATPCSANVIADTRPDYDHRYAPMLGLGLPGWPPPMLGRGPLVRLTIGVPSERYYAMLAGSDHLLVGRPVSVAPATSRRSLHQKTCGGETRSEQACILAMDHGPTPRPPLVGFNARGSGPVSLAIFLGDWPKNTGVLNIRNISEIMLISGLSAKIGGNVL